MEIKRASWSGQLAFVLAAAASAIGLGNLWRFPYLAAKYGGGAFIVVYLALSLTLGFTMLVTEIAIGRKSRQSQLTAFRALGFPRWSWVGKLSTIVPFLIIPYYAVIGGWVLNYTVRYAAEAAGLVPAIADPGARFNAFVASPYAPLFCMAVFLVATVVVIVRGVRGGIEKANAVLMPLLLAAAVALSVYVATLPGAGEGIRRYIVPDFSHGFNLGKILLGAMGQMFFSLSLAMGIMITYGSYLGRGSSVTGAAVRIALADTVVAVLAGFMVVPMMYVFAMSSGMGPDVELNAGPGLLFVSLPAVFGTLGPAGAWVGLGFFSLVFFAALTSAISMAEACIAALCDRFALSRRAAVARFLAITLVAGAIPAVSIRALESTDALVNSVLMPVAAIGIALFAGWRIGPAKLAEVFEPGGRKVGFEKFYSFAVKYLAPVLVAAILVSEICRTLGIGGWSI